MICKLAMQHLQFWSIFFQSKSCVVPTDIMHCDVTSMIFAYYSKRNFSRKKQNNELQQKSYQLILPYLYAEIIKRLGEISLHRHFKF